MTARTYVGLALSALLVIIITLNVAVPTLNTSLNAKAPTEATYVLTAPFSYGVAYYVGHAPVIQGSVKVYNSTYTAIEGTDYTFDYTNGTITVLSTGSLLNTSNYNVEYQYYTPVYTGTNRTLLQLTILMLVLGIVVIITATMLIRWL